jgi:hypothetical protein
MVNLAHSASFDSSDKDAPSKPGIKHLDHGLHAARTALVLDCLQRGHVADLNRLDDLGGLAAE